MDEHAVFEWSGRSGTVIGYEFEGESLRQRAAAEGFLRSGGPEAQEQVQPGASLFDRCLLMEGAALDRTNGQVAHVSVMLFHAVDMPVE